MYLKILFLSFLSLSLSQIIINHYETSPYVNLNWEEIELGKLEITFINEINRTQFRRIYLVNGTSEINIIDNCDFRAKTIKCLLSAKTVGAESNNKNYKFYYRVFYENKDRLKTDAFIIVAVSKSYFIKLRFFIFLLFLIF